MNIVAIHKAKARGCVKLTFSGGQPIKPDDVIRNERTGENLLAREVDGELVFVRGVGAVAPMKMRAGDEALLLENVPVVPVGPGLMPWVNDPEDDKLWATHHQTSPGSMTLTTTKG